MRKYSCLTLLMLLACMNANAQEPGVTPSAPVTAPVNTSVAATTLFKPGGWSFSVYGGRYDASYEPQFVGIRNKYGLGLGLSSEFAQIPYLGLDFELIYANRDYDTPVGAPLWGTIDNDTRVQTSGLLVGARAFYPASGDFRGYVSAGLGYFRTRMVVSGTVFGFPGIYEDTDTSVDPYYGLGIGYRFGNWGLSLDLRHFDLKGDFSAFNISNANLGGDLWLVGWNYRF